MAKRNTPHAHISEAEAKAMLKLGIGAKAIARAELDEIRRGAEAFRAVLRKIEATPEVLKPGYKRGEDDSTNFNFKVAEDAIYDAGLSKGFVRALACLLTSEVKGVTSGIEGFEDDDLLFATEQQTGIGSRDTGVPAERDQPDPALKGGAEPEPVLKPVITEERRMLALAACWQIEPFMGLVERVCGDDDDIGLRTLATRAKSLSCAIMSALDDKGADLDELHLIVHGQAREEEATNEAEASHG